MAFPSPASTKDGEWYHLISQQRPCTDIYEAFNPCSDQYYWKAHEEFNSSLFSTGYGCCVVSGAQGDTLYEEDKNIE